MPRQILLALVAIATAAALLAGCGGSDTPKSDSASAKPASAASGNSVTISDFKFAPASLTVKRGAKVTFTNHDSDAHTATANDGHSFDTGMLDQGSSRTITLTKPGSYAYHCTVHSFMKGTLVVR